MSAAAAIAAACCTTCARNCIDCIGGDVIDADAGCCHSSAEALCFRIERNGYTVVSHGFDGTNTSEECPGGCEISTVTTFASEDAIQVIYDYEARYFRCDFAAVGGDRPPQCDLNCDPDNDTCCGPPSFPPYAGCVCDPDALISPHMRPIMESAPQFKWLLDSACYGGSNCFPTRRSLIDCSEYGGGTTLYGQLLTVIHLEHWWKISECAGAVTPDLEANGIEVQIDCIAPKRWVYACSGAPLYDFDLRNAVEDGTLGDGEACEVLQSLGTGITPSQATLQKLWDSGYIRVKDWRAEIVAELAELKERFPTTYAGCTIPDCGDVAIVGPVRKRRFPCLNAGDVAGHTAPLQPALGACAVDPFGGDYPEDDSDPSWEDYVFWRDRQFTYFHARPGGWDWICFDPGATDGAIPDLLRRFSVNCPNGQCLDVSGFPRDFTCAAGPYVGTNPTTGLPTCQVGCEDEANPYDCIFPLLSCDTAGDGSTCANVAVAGSCDGLHFVYTLVQVEEVAVSECFPSGYRFKCGLRNDAYLFGLNRRCGGWSAADCHKCRGLSVPVAVADLLPDIHEGYLHHRGLCNQIMNGCSSAGDLCCGGYCLDLDSACPTVAVAGADCAADPAFEEREAQAACLP